MGAAEQRKRSQEAAAHLAARGIFHGKRQSVTHALPVPVSETGSAAYRRRMAAKRKGV